MIFNKKINQDFLKYFKTSSTAVASFFLTFLYVIELSLGIRTVIYVLHVWNQSRLTRTTTDDISWMIVVTCLLLSVVSSCTVNAISAFWDSNYSSGVRSAIFYAIHILTGGVIWRYVNILRCDTPDTKEEQAILCASVKFFFTQFFTIPLLIIHIFLLHDLFEFVYVLIIMLSISVSIILTCIVFEKYEPYGEYPYETMTLVPLLFQKLPKKDNTIANEKPTREEETVATVANKEELMKSKYLWRFLAGTQIFFFTSGRVLALGVLLKLAGVYGITIIVLQILLSIVYLKFQANYIVPDTISKFKQLMRLMFLSYVLVFEWHLNRDAVTGFTSNFGAKHGIVYYSITTVESMLYLILWTATFTDNKTLSQSLNLNFQHIRIVTTIGCVNLVLSYVIAICLIFSKMQSLSSLTDLIPRIRKMSGRCLQIFEFKKTEKSNVTPVASAINVCNDVGHNKDGKEIHQHGQLCLSDGEQSVQSGSYRDLRECIDEDDAIKNQSISQTARQIDFDLSKDKTIQHTQHCRNDVRSSSNNNSIKVDKEQSKNKKKLLVPPKYLRETFSTARFPIVKIKFAKDFNFIKSAKQGNKATNNTESNPASSKYATVFNKINTRSNSLSNQFGRLTNIKSMVGFSQKSEDSKKAESSPENITIPTIMNEYKEELPLNPSTLRSSYKPPVPPRTTKHKPEKKQKMNNMSAMNSNYTDKVSQDPIITQDVSSPNLHQQRKNLETDNLGNINVLPRSTSHKVSKVKNEICNDTAENKVQENDGMQPLGAIIINERKNHHLTKGLIINDVTSSNNCEDDVIFDSHLHSIQKSKNTEFRAFSEENC